MMQTTKPEEVGLSSSRLERIRPVMESYIAQGKLPGMVAIVARRGEVAYAECFGMMDIEAGKPIQFDTLFRTYSMSKTITSAAVLSLYEEGRFALNDPVAMYIPEFKDLKVLKEITDEGVEVVDQDREMTIRDLFVHTAGFTYGLEDTPLDRMYREAEVIVPDKGITENLIQKLAKLPLAHQPGTAWLYSLSYDVLGCLVEILSGIALDRYLEERVWGPLGMEDTGFFVPEHKHERFMPLYTPADNGGFQVLDPATTGSFSQPPDFLAGGSGIVTRAGDYLRLLQMLLNQGQLDGFRLLSRKTVELMTTNHLPQTLLPFGEDTEGYGLGLGLEVLMDIAQAQALGTPGAFRWGGAASTGYCVDPKEQLIVLLMTQMVPGDYYPMRQLTTLAYQAIVD